MGEWLSSWIPWGTEAILWVQSFRTPWLDAVFVAATWLGEEYFFLAFLPLVYWCVSRRLGIRLSYLVLLSNYVNGWAKLVYALPRPDDPRIVLLRHEASPSFPSGHAQNAIALWGYLALYWRRGWFWAVAAVLILLIGFSRIYVGVHFPQDVIGGIIGGALFLGIYRGIGERGLVPWWSRRSMALRLALGVMIPLILLFIYPRDYLGYYPAENASTVAGAWIGMHIGFTLAERRLRFSAAGRWWKRALRVPLGALLIALFYAGPKWLMPETWPMALAIGGRLIRYALVGFVLAYGAPWLFITLRLAEQEPLPSHTSGRG